MRSTAEETVEALRQQLTDAIGKNNDLPEGMRAQTYAIELGIDPAIVETLAAKLMATDNLMLARALLDSRGDMQALATKVKTAQASSIFLSFLIGFLHAQNLFAARTASDG